MKHTHPTAAGAALALTAAAFVAALAFANPAMAAPGTNEMASTHAAQMARNDRIETRIADLHTKLHITAAQDSLWQNVATVMRDNASTMSTIRQDRIDHAKGMTAVEDMASYKAMADAHADGVRKLNPPFKALYDSMSDVQKRNADSVFRTNPHHI